MRFRLFLLALASLALTSCELYDRLTDREEALYEARIRAYHDRQIYGDSGIGVKRD